MGMLMDCLGPAPCEQCGRPEHESEESRTPQAVAALVLADQRLRQAQEAQPECKIFREGLARGVMPLPGHDGRFGEWRALENDWPRLILRDDLLSRQWVSLQDPRGFPLLGKSLCLLPCEKNLSCSTMQGPWRAIWDPPKANRA